MSSVETEKAVEENKERPRERLLTGEEFADLYPDKPWVELVEGRVIEVTPPGFEHGWIEINIGSILRDYVRRQKLGRVAGGDAGMYTRRNPDSVRGADVFFISNERLEKRSRKKGYLDVAPELVVEVLSPNDRWKDVNAKIREYFAAGVVLLWLVDPEGRSVSVYRAPNDVREFGKDDVITGEDALPGFSCPVKEFFEE